MIEIYTDGSCLRNPDGPGGFAVVIYENKNLYTYHYERCESTTNNIEELKAILYAICWSVFNTRSFDITIYSDSAYAINSVTQWAKTWEKNGWRRNGDKEIKNLELIKKIYYLLKKYSYISLEKVKGHNDISGNELADKLASGRLDFI